MKRPVYLILSISAIIIISVPLSILITLLLSPFWSWLESSTGIESLGHSGPAEWCYVVTFLSLVSIIIAIFLKYTQHKKRY